MLDTILLCFYFVLVLCCYSACPLFSMVSVVVTVFGLVVMAVFNVFSIKFFQGMKLPISVCEVKSGLNFPSCMARISN